MSDFFQPHRSYALYTCGSRVGSETLLTIVYKKLGIKSIPNFMVQKFEDELLKNAQEESIVFKNYWGPTENLKNLGPEVRKVFLYRRSLKDQLRSWCVATHNNHWHWYNSDGKIVPNHQDGPRVIEPPLSEYTVYPGWYKENFMVDKFIEWLNYYDFIRQSGEEHLLLCYEDLFLDPNHTLLSSLFGEEFKQYFSTVKTPPEYYEETSYLGETIALDDFAFLIERFAEKGITLSSEVAPWASNNCMTGS
jgi:hypothetical protein